MFKSGERVGYKYIIISDEPLGKGGWGTVWLAKNVQKDLVVAIKVLNYDELVLAAAEKMRPKELLNYGKKLRSLFHREGTSLERLAGHSNVVSVLDSDVCKKENDAATIVSFIVMEYIEGDNGLSLVGCNDISKCLRVALGACSGLAYAHSFNIIHRDIKPGNILLGNNGCVKVTDFGLAKNLDESTGEFTARGIGTVQYMAPEQYSRDPKTNEKTDIYQFGATLFYIFTGVYADPHNLLEQFSTDPKSSLSPIEINPNIPKSVSDLIMRMLSEEGKDRPGLKEVEETLQRAEQQSRSPNDVEINKYRYLEPIINIRRALKDRVKNEIEFLQSSANLVPGRQKKPVWYATVLLRPLITAPDGSKSLANSFTLIYFVEYTGSKITAVADWDNNAALTHTPLPIEKCCAGLPIRWHDERDAWRDQYGDNFYWIQPDHQRLGQPKYIILDNVRDARTVAAYRPNLVYDNYATADKVPNWPRSVGWGLIDSETREPKLMSQDIETEIIVPIYSSASSNIEGEMNEVLGVVNFEWDEPFSPQERQYMANEIIHHIHNRHILGVTRFTCEVLYNVTLPDDN